MKNLITKFTYLILFLLISSTSLALETEIIRDLDKWREKIATLDWKNLEEKEFRASVPGSNGNIKIDKEEIFLVGNDVNQYAWWTWGYGDSTPMLIKHTNRDQIFIQYIDDGFIKIDDLNFGLRLLINLFTKNMLQGATCLFLQLKVMFLKNFLPKYE